MNQYSNVENCELFAGEDERQEQAGATAAGSNQGLSAETGREDQGDPEDMAADNGAALGSFSQHLHSGLWRLLRPVLLSTDYRGRADPTAHRWIHRHHSQEGMSLCGS